jgi:hypothetical protein
MDLGGINLSREEAKQKLTSFGIETPTEQQITDYLNSVNGEVQKEKTKLQTDKAEFDRLKAIEKEFEETKNASLTAEEKYQKALKDLEDKAKLSTRELNKLKAENILVAAGLKPDDYVALLDGMVSDDAEKTVNLATGLATLVKNQKEATDKAVRAEVLNNTPAPNGGSGDGKAPKTEAEKVVESLASAKAETLKASQSTLNTYMGGNK